MICTNDDSLVSLYENRIKLMEERHQKELQTLDLHYETKLLHQEMENYHHLVDSLQNKDREVENQLQKQRSRLEKQFQIEREKESSSEEDNTKMLLKRQLEIQEQVKFLTQRHEEEKLVKEESIKYLKLKLACRNIQKFKTSQTTNAFLKWKKIFEIGKMKDIYNSVQGISTNDPQTKTEIIAKIEKQEKKETQEIDFSKSLRGLPLSDSNSDDISTSRSRRGSRILLDDKDILIKSLEANLAEYNHHIEEHTMEKSIYEKEKREMQQLILKLKRENTILSSHVLTMIQANIKQGKIDFSKSKRSTSDQPKTPLLQTTKKTSKSTFPPKSKEKEHSKHEDSVSTIEGQDITQSTDIVGVNSINDNDNNNDNNNKCTYTSKNVDKSREENSYHSPINFVSENTGVVHAIKDNDKSTFENDTFKMRNPLQNHDVKEAKMNNNISESKNYFDFTSTVNFKEETSTNKTDKESQNDNNINETDNPNSLTNSPSSNSNENFNIEFSEDSHLNNTLSSPFSPTESFSSSTSSFSVDSFSENSPNSLSSIDKSDTSDLTQSKENTTDEFSEGFDNDWSSFDSDNGIVNEGFQDPFKIPNEGIDSNKLTDSSSTGFDSDPFKVSSDDPFSSGSTFPILPTKAQKGEGGNEITVNSFFDEDPFGSESKF